MVSPVGPKIIPDPNGIYTGIFQSGEVYEDRLNCSEAWPSDRSGRPADPDVAHVDIAARFVSFSEIEEHLKDGEGLTKIARSAFPNEDAEIIKERGGTLFIKLEPWSYRGINDDTFTLDQILANDHDRLLIAFAKEAADYGGPVFVTFGHEMNGDWYPWSGDPEKYKKVYRYVHDMISSTAPNVTWVWNPDAQGNDQMDYYPGNDYVDWVAVDGYDRRGDMTFAQIFGPAMDRLSTATSKPIMIGEFATTREDKAGWLEDAIAWMETDGRVKGFLYFDVKKSETEGVIDWRIREESDRMAFMKAMQDRAHLFRSNIITNDGELKDRADHAVDAAACEEFDRERFLSAGEKESYLKLRRKLYGWESIIPEQSSLDAQAYRFLARDVHYDNWARIEWALSLTKRGRYMDSDADNNALQISALEVLGFPFVIQEEEEGQTVQLILSYAFSESEFSRAQSVEALYQAIAADAYPISFSTPDNDNSVERLNEILHTSNFYDLWKAKGKSLTETEEIRKLIQAYQGYKAMGFTRLTEVEEMDIEHLNRLLIEGTYPQECPTGYGNFSFPEEFEDQALIYYPGIPYVRDYFELLMQGADIMIRVNPQETIKICEKIEQEIKMARIRTAHSVRYESIDGIEARTKMLRALALQEVGGPANEYEAAFLYDEVIEWAFGTRDRETNVITEPGEIDRWGWASSLRLLWKTGSIVELTDDLFEPTGFYYERIDFLPAKDKVRYVGMMAKVGKAELEKTGHDEKMGLFDGVLSWEKIGEEHGHLDLGLRALIGAAEVCILNKAQDSFNKLDWEKINTYKDLKKVLNISNVDLVTEPNKLRLIVRSLYAIQDTLDPLLRERLEKINKDNPTEIKDMRR